MKHTLILLLCFFMTACIRKVAQEPTKTKSRQSDSLNIYCVADTIIYDVIIRNTNPYDTWIEKSLGKLKHNELIDSLFGLVHEQEAKAYDYFSGEELTKKQIEALENEPGFSREQIGKIQFTEAWYFNKKSGTLKKEVLSVALGHELYGDSGEIRGYKPVFKIYLNP